MGEAVNQAGGEGDPKRLRCRKCGCEHLPVLYTRHVKGAVVRVRECRHCGTRLRTREQAAGIVAGGRSEPPASGTRRPSGPKK